MEAPVQLEVITRTGKGHMSINFNFQYNAKNIRRTVVLYACC